MDLLRYAVDQTKSQRSGEWLNGPAISAHDVKHGRGAIQHITADEWFGRPAGSRQPDGCPVQTGKGTGNPSPSQSPKMAQPPLHVMRFGKYRDRPMSEVQSMDPGYWAWLLRDVDGFAAKARKAGLMDDE